MCRWRSSSIVLALLVVPAAVRGQFWSSAPTDIWAVSGLVSPFHWDGRGWSVIPLPDDEMSIRGLWSSGPRDAFAVGDAGLILHSDGRAWTRMRSGTERDIVGVAGRSATEVYALVQSEEETRRPVLLRYDGRTWSSIPLPFPFVVGGLAVTPTEVLVAGYVIRDPRPNQRKIFGVLARYAGGVWRFTGFDGQRINEPAIGRIGWTGVSAAGSAILLRGDRPDTTRDVEDADWGSAEGPVLALTTGAGWRLIVPPAGNNAKFTLVGGDGVPVVLDEEGAGVARYTAGRWTTVRSPAPGEGESPAPVGVTGPSSTDFYVLRYDGIVMHVVGNAMTPMNKEWVAQQMEAEEQRAMQQADAEREVRAEEHDQERAAAAAELARRPPTERDLGVPLYPGARLNAQVSAGMSQESEHYYVYQSDDPVATVVRFYEQRTGKRAAEPTRGHFMIAVRGTLPWPDLGVTIEPNMLGGPAKTVITVRKVVEQN